MIRYLLGCDAGHEFEAWFDSIAGFETQARDGLVTCPMCGSDAVDRRPMAPAVVGTRKAKRPEREPTRSPTSVTNTEALPLDVLRELRSKIIAETTDVGRSFAEEARRIHDGDAEARAIRGEATNEELKSLVDDDIPFGIVPRLPEDSN